MAYVGQGAKKASIVYANRTFHSFFPQKYSKETTMKSISVVCRITNCSLSNLKITLFFCQNAHQWAANRSWNQSVWHTKARMVHCGHADCGGRHVLDFLGFAFSILCPQMINDAARRIRERASKVMLKKVWLFGVTTTTIKTTIAQTATTTVIVSKELYGQRYPMALC